MIDLSKLKALEMPTKEIEVEILGEIQKVKITCPGDDIAAKVSSMYRLRPADPDLPVDIVTVFLTSALPELKEEDIRDFVKKDFSAASNIAGKARDLMNEFIDQKIKIHEEAKKKRKKDVAATTSK